MDRFDYGAANGHDPMAAKVVCIDYDATIFPWGPLMAEMEPLPGAVKAIKRLKKKGYRIVILTSRLSAKWLKEAFPDDPATAYYAQLIHIEKMLTRFGIPFNQVIGEKIPAEYYIDDKAIEFKNNWEEIENRLLGSE
jgi:hydroxymethylpyrimidine pyrophosphatase-like HAD family hydrolase